MNGALNFTRPRNISLPVKARLAQHATFA